MQRGLRAITLQGAIDESPILLSQYWKNEWLDGNIIISYFGGSNNIFVDCMYILHSIDHKHEITISSILQHTCILIIALQMIYKILFLLG